MIMDKLIFVFEGNQQDRKQLDSVLRRRGFTQLEFVQTNAEVFACIRQFQDHPQRLCAVIVNNTPISCDIDSGIY